MNTTTLKLHPQVIKNINGENEFVVLPTKEYEELLEDLQDLVAIAERRDEAKLSIQELENTLKADGIL